jgi:hypothetical protein
VKAWWTPLLALLLAGCGAHASATATPTPSATPPPAALAHFTNPAYPYEIGYPAGWKPVTANPDSVRFEGPGGREISVVAQAVPDRKPPRTLAEYADQQVEALRQATPGLIELARNRVGLPNEQTGVEVDVAWGTAQAPHRALLLYVLSSGLGYSLRADAPAVAFAAERRSLGAALHSFTLTPPD